MMPYKILTCIGLLAASALADSSPKGFAPVPDQPGYYGVALEVADGKTHFKEGEPLSLRFRCDAPGHLTIISIDPTSEAILMYPNEWAPESLVTAGRWLDIPGPNAGFKLIARPPFGCTYVRAIMTPEPLVSVDQLRKATPRAFAPLGSSRGGKMRQLLDEVRGFVPEPDAPEDPNDEPIAVITLKLEIVEQRVRTQGGRRADGKIQGEIPEGADLDGLMPVSEPKARLLAALRDSGLQFSERHAQGLTIPPTFSFDRKREEGQSPAVAAGSVRKERSVELLVDNSDGLNSMGDLAKLRVERIQIRGSDDLNQARQRLLAGGARHVQINHVDQAFGPVTDEPMIHLQWALKNSFRRAAETGALTAVENATRRPIVVAVVDSGMVANHPDLSRAMFRNEHEVAGNGIDDDNNGLIDDVSGFDFVANTANLLMGASHNHGTFVASVIASRVDGRGIVGICPWAEILPIRAGSAEGFYTADSVKSLIYAGESGAKIVNCSWGGYRQNQAIIRAIDFLRDKGVLVVCAAGNDGNDNDVHPATPASYPHDNIISVAAMRVDGALADFSNYGAETVDLAAPGELIVGYPDGSGNVEVWDGTSFSSPMVAGAAAAIWAKHPDWTYREVKDTLLATARRMPELKGKVVSGGMLDLEAALQR